MNTPELDREQPRTNHGSQNARHSGRHALAALYSPGSRRLDESSGVFTPRRLSPL